MQPKHLFLLLTMTSLCNAVVCHIVTSSHDLPLLYCMRLLTSTLRTNLCANAPYTPQLDMYTYFPGLPKVPSSSDFVEKQLIVRNCCLKPCTVSQLMAIC